MAHRAAAQVLADNGLATLNGKPSGKLLMGPYLRAAGSDRTWQQLKGAGKHAELTGTVFIASTDPVSSNSGALYLAAASYVADGGRVASDEAAIDRTAPLLKKLIQVQGRSRPAVTPRSGTSSAGSAIRWSWCTSRRSPRC